MSDAPKTNIEPKHINALQALIDPNSETEFVLMSCFVNGEPTCAISFIGEDGRGGKSVHPVFVAITPGMVLKDHNGTVADEHGGKRVS